MLLPRAAAVLAALATLLLPGVASGATCGPDVPQGRLYRDEMNADTECGSECGRSCFQRADVEANIYLAGDYDARVGDARPTFLEECTGAFVQAGHGVACRQVHDDQASIRVVVGGPEDDVHAAREAARDTGLALQSFLPQLFLEPFDPMYCTRYVGFERTCWADTAYGVCQPKGQESYNLIMRETDVRKQYKLKAGCGRLVPQQCLDADAAATTFQGATCAAIQANALCAGDAYKFKTCAGQGQCGCPAEGEPGHVKGATWGLSSDCSSGGSCLAGCSADGQSFTGGALTAKQLSDLAAEASSGETTLNSAMDALAGHIKGTSVLSRSNLAAQSIKFEQFGALLKRTPALVKKAFDLVDTFESSSGGALFVRGVFDSTGRETRGAFKRKATSTDGHELERAMLQVQQVLMDDVYNAGVLSECSRAVFAGRGWETASFYPGAAPPPTDTNLVHSVVVKAVFSKTWGKAVAYARDHAQKPTGLYLSPGSIGTVTVPTILVGKGYRILVGAQVSDNKWKSEVRRMDRVATRFEITTATTLIANPLGGGVYIMVPPLADAGLVEVKISGGVIKAPLFQRTSFNQMTNAEWKARRTAPAPWADFETDNFMLNVPRSWIYAYDDPEALMERYAKSMEGAAEWLGYPPAYRNRKVLFVGVDLHIKASAYGIGYPQVNTNYNAGRDYGGNYNHDAADERPRLGRVLPRARPRAAHEQVPGRDGGHQQLHVHVHRAHQVWRGFRQGVQRRAEPLQLWAGRRCRPLDDYAKLPCRQRDGPLEHGARPDAVPAPRLRQVRRHCPPVWLGGLHQVLLPGESRPQRRDFHRRWDGRPHAAVLQGRGR